MFSRVCVYKCVLAWLTDRSKCYDDLALAGLRSSGSRDAVMDAIGTSGHGPFVDKELGGISKRHDVARYLFLFTRAGRIE